MAPRLHKDRLDELIGGLVLLWDDPQERILLDKTVRALEARYGLRSKITREPGVVEIITQLVGRLAASFGKLSSLPGTRVLDIACGSNSSRAPARVHIHTSFGGAILGRPSRGYTALFEPWFCRILFELGADPVGIDFGDLEAEAFTHYRVDLGKAGSLDFLPDRSFDAVHDSRLFGSPEFTAQFPDQEDRLKVAREITRQERRLLKVGGILIHSDAKEWAG
jgi:hypothetical protein